MTKVRRFGCTKRIKLANRAPKTATKHGISENEEDTRNVVERPKAILILLSAICIAAFPPTSAAPGLPADSQQVMKVVDKQGDYKANVLKVNLPRSDLHMKIAGYFGTHPLRLRQLVRHEQIGDPIIADSILDRILHNAWRISTQEPGPQTGTRGWPMKGRAGRTGFQLKHAKAGLPPGREVGRAASSCSGKPIDQA
jgi:hypothetical protein